MSYIDAEFLIVGDNYWNRWRLYKTTEHFLTAFLYSIQHQTIDFGQPAEGTLQINLVMTSTDYPDVVSRASFKIVLDKRTGEHRFSGPGAPYSDPGI